MTKLKGNEIKSPDGFIDISEAIKLLNVCSNKVRDIANSFNFKTKTITLDNGGSKKLYLKKDLLAFKTDFDKFWDKHIVFSSIEKIYGKKISSMANKIEVPSYYRRTSAKYVASIQELESLKNDYLNNYFLYDEALNLLKLNKESMTKALKEFNIKPIRLIGGSNKSGLLKKDIMAIKEKQTEFLNNALTYDYVRDSYGASIVEKNKSYELPYFARNIDFFNGKTVYYKKDEVEKSVTNRDEKEQSFNIELDTLYDTYIVRLNIKKFKGFENKPYSESKWNQYIARKLKNVSGSYETANNTVNLCVRACIRLFNYLDKTKGDKEIYTLSTKEINFFFNSTTNQIHRLVYMFFKEVAQDIKLSKIENKKRRFDFAKLKSPYKSNEKEEVQENTYNELYTFEEYIEIFCFLSNIDFHLNRLSKIKNEKEKIIYLSIWLYLSIQLTNTWRKGDICEFPKLNWDYILIEEKINNMDWFYHNKISKEVGRRIVTTLIHHPFIVSKTDKGQPFRASDTVCQLLGTILLLLDLNNKEQVIISDKYNDVIMFFNNKVNKPSPSMLKKFFNGINLPNFTFRNKNMTKSIMSYTNIIAPAEYGILIAKNQRAHNELSSTVHYVKIPKEHMDFLSEQLFERGQFGGLYDALLGLMIGNKDSDIYFKERTEIIKEIQKSFGDITKVESSLRLTTYNTQTEVIDMLFSKDLNECSNILTNIHFNNLPSKEEHIQCIYSNSGCIHPERQSYPKGEGCISCECSIPNIYAITVLADRLKQDYIEYSTTTNLISKRKLSMRIFKYREVLKNAIAKYGNEYIYSCIGLDISREEFLKILSSVENPFNLNTSPLHRFIGGSK